MDDGGGRFAADTIHLWVYTRSGASQAPRLFYYGSPTDMLTSFPDVANGIEKPGALGFRRDQIHATYVLKATTFAQTFKIKGNAEIGIFCVMRFAPLCCIGIECSGHVFT
jgi:hypothetical protein